MCCYNCILLMGVLVIGNISKFKNDCLMESIVRLNKWILKIELIIENSILEFFNLILGFCEIMFFEIWNF